MEKFEKLQKLILNLDYSIAIKKVKEYGFEIKHATYRGNIDVLTSKGIKTLKCLPLN